MIYHFPAVHTRSGEDSWEDDYWYDDHPIELNEWWVGRFVFPQQHQAASILQHPLKVVAAFLQGLAEPCQFCKNNYCLILQLMTDRFHESRVSFKVFDFVLRRLCDWLLSERLYNSNRTFDRMSSEAAPTYAVKPPSSSTHPRSGS